MRLVQWGLAGQFRCTRAARIFKQIQLLKRYEQKNQVKKQSRLQLCSHPRIPHPGIRGTLPMGNHDDRAAYVARVRSDSAAL